MELNQIKALINLLEDSDPQVYEVAKEKLIEIGASVVAELEKKWENSMNEVLHERIEDIISHIQFSATKENLMQWAKGGGLDLLEGAFWIAKYQYPDLEYMDIVKRVEVIRQDIWGEMINNLTPLEKVKILNHIIFDVHQFTRNAQDFNAPHNSYINLVLENKRGNPVSLAIIYATIAQKLGLPIYGVNLPRNFILAYTDELFPAETAEEINTQNVLFYVNPYNHGAVLGKREIDYFIKQQKLKQSDTFYKPCSNIEIVKRLIRNLIYSYENLGYPEKIKDFKRLMEIFE